MAEGLTQAELEASLQNNNVVGEFARLFANNFKDAWKGSGVSKTIKDASEATKDAAKKQKEAAERLEQSADASFRMKKAEGLINQDFYSYIKEFGSQLKANNADQTALMSAKMWDTAKDSFEHYDDFQERVVSEARVQFKELGYDINTLDDVFAIITASGKDLNESIGILSANVINKGPPAFNTLGRTIRKSVTKFSSLDIAIGTALKSFTQLGQDVKAQIRVGDVYQKNAGIVDRYSRALSMGIDPGAFAELNAETRRAALSTGSLSGFMDMLGDQHRDAFDVVGDTKEATRFLGGMYATLATRGIKPTSEGLKGLTSSFGYLQKVTGMTSDQYRSHLDDLMNDENVMLKLRTANSNKERQQIIANTMTRLKENVALGMTVDQAKETTKALHRLAGEDPMTRFEKGAKLQASMQAMGVAGGARANRLMQMGERKDAAERAELQGYLTRTSEKFTATKTGAYGTEFMAAGILSKTGMEDVLGSSSPFQMQFADSLKVQQGMAKSLETIAERSGILSGGAYFSDIFGSAIASSPLAGILSATTSLVGFFVQGYFGAAIAVAMAKAAPAAAVSTAASTAAMTASTAATGFMGPMKPAAGAAGFMGPAQPKAARAAKLGGNAVKGLGMGIKSVIPALIPMISGALPLILGVGAVALVGTLAYKALSKSDKKSAGPATERQKTVEFDALERLQMTMQGVENNTFDTVQILGRMEAMNQNIQRYTVEKDQRVEAEIKRNSRVVASGSSPKSAPSGKPTTEA